MKPKFAPITIALVMFLFIGTSAIAQTTHVITLRVNTDRITASNVNQESNFGQSSRVSNKDFTVFAYKGDYIEWQAVDSSNSGRSVTVEEIKYESGKNLFDQPNFKKIGSNKKIKKKISKGKKNQKEKYVIIFSFEKGGKKYTYQIDPKIIIKG